MENILTLVSNYIFPIAACIVLYIELGKIREDHKEEVGSLKQALDNNTAVLIRLEEHLKKGA